MDFITFMSSSEGRKASNIIPFLQKLLITDDFANPAEIWQDY
jgi:hypothetical protein